MDRLRNEAGLSKERMAVLLGVSRQAYYNFLRGAVPRRKRADEINAVLDRVETVLRDGSYVKIDHLSYDERYARLMKVI